MVHRWVVVSAIVVTVTVIIVLGLIPVYLRKEKNTVTTPASSTIADLLDASLNALSVYPNGSYMAKISEFTQSTNTNLSFLPLDQILLNQLSNIDNTSFIFEAGREQFLYFRIPEEVFTLQRNTLSLSGIAIHFGHKTDSLNVVPISDRPQQSSGVNIIPTNLPDRSKLLRIQIATTSTMCSQTGILDSCTSVEYSAYLIFGKTQLSVSAVTNQANVACGDICSLSSSYSACSASCGSQCDGDQVAGADTPVSRRYNLGRKYGHFKFMYETYTIQDRIKVWNGIDLLFDSGCIGTKGVRSTYLTLSNNVNVRIDVEPNCACQSLTGCTGTLWHFTVVCPEVCSPEQYKLNGGNTLKITSDGKEVTNGMTLYITEGAVMPSLVASSCEPVSWEVSFNYQATFTGALSFSKTVNGQSSESASFDIVRSLQNETLGGSVTSRWTILATKESGEIIFRILGKSPTKNAIMNYIGAHSSLWYAKNIAAQESNGGQQFISTGYPLVSSASDNGYGIYQITNPPPTYNEVWNWKANVNKGIQILNQKTDAANTWMIRQRAQAEQETGSKQPVDDESVGRSCFFSDNGSRTITDAVAIKQFNGASGGNYCAWDNNNSKWKFNRENNRGENYVLFVCNRAV